MLGKGTITEQQAADVNDKMAGALEELRVKYERLAEEKAAADAAAAAAAREASGEAARARAAAVAASVDLTEADPDVEALRQARLAALRERAAAARGAGAPADAAGPGAGEVREIAEEEFLPTVTGAVKVAVHFYHDEFAACALLDKHLRALAPAARGVRIVRLAAAKAPFFVAKLKVAVLPSLLFFSEGVYVGRQVGLDGLMAARADAAGGGGAGGKAPALEDFPTARLAGVFAEAGMLDRRALPPGLRGGDDEDDEEDGGGEEEEGGGGGGGGGGGRGRAGGGRARRGGARGGPAAAGGGGGAGGGAATQMERARQRMLEAIADEDLES